MNNTDQEIYKKIYESTEKPLIHYITNYVTVNDMANMTLAFGGSPIMAEAVEELEEITRQCQCLVINIGTITSDKVTAIHDAIAIANRHHIPVIIDPVGVAATSYRKKMIMDILETFHVDIIKGNGSEIKAILGLTTQAKGVDGEALEQTELTDIGVAVAKRYNAVVAITGKDDMVCSASKVAIVKGDTPRLTEITGTGCMISTLISVAYARCKDPFASSVYGMLAMHTAASDVEELLDVNQGIGSYKVMLFDAIYKRRHTNLLDGGGVVYHDIQ
ncbi:hydroxyethylthiazole kinase [Vallitalea pronyensis]|uniref:Hydroxyethylthiazole kinase n=1 Tax=Vallitalea pronyensis TaxID=1348613 RepID=A0A8J8ML74_9FIRM|nr:hydroxyethylthiazole kinase [Vallitalea pronyensis]QUI23288.1 hydroxyethylthiazole kinase [Vallitalea pronyensis]